MNKLVVFCDNCGSQLRVVRSKDIFGNDVEVVKHGLLNIFGTPTKIQGMDFCEVCADKINKQLLLFKKEVLEQ